MKKVKEDDTNSLGAYEVDVSKRPIDFNDKSQYTQLRLGVFQNKPKKDENEYTMNLSYKLPGNKRFHKFNASLLNTFEPMRWMRNFEQSEQRSQASRPLYFDWIKERRRILQEYKKDDIMIRPTAGFFHEVLDNRGFVGNTYLDAYATLHWTKDWGVPRVNIRFFDYTYESIFLEENDEWELGCQNPRWIDTLYVEPNKHIKVA